MQKVFIISILVTILFSLIKFAEMKFIDKKMKPLKYMVRDMMIVFGCTILATFVYFHLDKNVTEFFNIVTENKTIHPSTTQIFTDEPGF